MEFINEQYRVVMHVEKTPQPERFDIIHNPENIDTDDFYMARVVRISKSNGKTLTVALLDTICSCYEPCAVLSKNILTVILFRSIMQIDLDTGFIVQYAQCDNMGGLFEIYQINGGCIIWGQGGIFRYDSDLNQIWRFSGRDMLVSQTVEKSFRIEDGLIHCHDWEGSHFVLDYDGNLISETHNTPAHNQK